MSTACLPSCRPILSLVLTGSPSPTTRSRYSSSKRSGFSLPAKGSHTDLSGSDGRETSVRYKDDRRLFARLDEQGRSHWPNSEGSHTATVEPAKVNIPASKVESKNGSHIGPWLSSTCSRGRVGSITQQDVEVQPPPLARGISINVRNDADIRWTAKESV